VVNLKRKDEKKSDPCHAAHCTTPEAYTQGSTWYKQCNLARLTMLVRYTVWSHFSSPSLVGDATGVGVGGSSLVVFIRCQHHGACVCGLI